jgi:FO synthase
MAGTQHGSRKSVEELEGMVRDAGRAPRQRTTLYGEPDAERLAAARRGPVRELPVLT